MQRTRDEILQDALDLNKRQEVLEQCNDPKNPIDAIVNEIERIEQKFEALEQELHGKVGQ